VPGALARRSRQQQNPGATYMEISMRIHHIGLVSGLAMLAPFAAFAADPAAPAADSPPPAQAASLAPSNPVVCHYFYYQGTVIKRPDCLTLHQWERRRLTEQRSIREFQQRALEEQ
ncbi:MAG TPA: hypothetical protein VIY09_00040, partial [Rhizomicrobium sp.]